MDVTRRESSWQFCEGNSTVECQLPKLNAAGSIPVPRSKILLKVKNFSIILLVAGVYFISGCATTEEIPPRRAVIPLEGVYHKVRQGETLWRIAKMYHVSVEDLVASNRIPNAAQIERNQLIFIPGAKTTQEYTTVERDAAKTGDFDWPLKGKIISYFGEQKDAWINNGLDIQSEAGEKVIAARNGQVVFADYLNGYGETVILDHADDFFTVYSQNASLLVKLDDVVTKGTPVAEVGQNNGRAFLHFEVRKNAIATNPLYYLP